jgi:outer membrane factor, OMF family
MNQLDSLAAQGLAPFRSHIRSGWGRGWLVLMAVSGPLFSSAPLLSQTPSQTPNQPPSSTPSQIPSQLPAQIPGQPLSPTTCDTTALPLAPSPSPSGNVDLGSLPQDASPQRNDQNKTPNKATNKAADLSKLEGITPPTTSLDIPQSPAAVTVDRPQPLSLAQALELGRSRSRDLQISGLEVEQQRAAVGEARAALYPAVDVEAGISRSDSAQAKIAVKQQRSELRDQIDQLAQIPAPTPEQVLTLAQLRRQLRSLENESTASNSFSGSLSLNYDIFTSGQRPASIRAAEAALKSTEQAYQTQLQQVRLDVANDYFDLQQADELVRIARQTVTNAEENLRVTQAREAQGVGTRFEVLQAEVALADRRQQLIQAENQQQTSRRQLAQRLSFPDTITPTASDPVGIIGEWSPSLEESIVRALQGRTELAQVLEQRQIAQQNRRVALGSLGPQLAFNANVELADDLIDSNLGAFGYGVGAEASKTIFDGGSAKAIAKEQQLNASIAETQFASFKQLIRFQVEQNYYTLRSSRERIVTTRCAIEQAQQGLNLAKLRRDYGVGTSLEVSDATTDLAQAENNYLSAIVDYNRALAALQRFVASQSPPQP